LIQEARRPTARLSSPSTRSSHRLPSIRLPPNISAFIRSELRRTEWWSDGGSRMSSAVCAGSCQALSAWHEPCLSRNRWRTHEEEVRPRSLEESEAFTQSLTRTNGGTCCEANWNARRARDVCVDSARRVRCRAGGGHHQVRSRAGLGCGRGV